jgi:hypothetical protein
MDWMSYVAIAAIAGVWLHHLWKCALRRGKEAGYRLAREEARKQAEEQHAALMRLLSDQVTEQLTNIVDARNRGIVRSRLLQSGEFRGLCKLPINRN